jgi:hypothetical protein
MSLVCLLMKLELMFIAQLYFLHRDQAGISLGDIWPTL